MKRIEFIRQMGEKELAKFLLYLAEGNTSTSCTICSKRNSNFFIPLDCDGKCEESIENWLKEDFDESSATSLDFSQRN